MFARDILHHSHQQGLLAVTRFIQRYGRINQVEIDTIFRAPTSQSAIVLAAWGDLASKYAHWADYISTHLVSDIDHVQLALADVLRMKDPRDQRAEAFRATGAQVLAGHCESDQERYHRYLDDLEAVLQTKAADMKRANE